MKTHEELITLIGNMFTDAYVAGDRKDLDSFRTAKAQREHLYDEIRDLYAELEHESYEREQIQVELNKANHRIEGLQRDYDHMREIKDRLLMLKRDKDDELKVAKQMLDGIYGDMISHVDDRSLYPASKPEDLKEAFAKYSTIPDDGDKFSEQDLPFPDVDDLAPASEVEVSEVVAGVTPATAEASADAEGE